MFHLNVYGGVDVTLRMEHTPKGALVTLVEANGAPYARLSVFVAQTLAEMPRAYQWTTDHFWLKDWSENEAVVAELIEKGYIEIDTSIEPIPSGHVEIKAACISAPRQGVGVFVLDSFDQIKD